MEILLWLRPSCSGENYGGHKIVRPPPGGGFGFFPFSSGGRLCRTNNEPPLPSVYHVLIGTKRETRPPAGRLRLLSANPDIPSLRASSSGRPHFFTFSPNSTSQQSPGGSRPAGFLWRAARH